MYLYVFVYYVFIYWHRIFLFARRSKIEVSPEFRMVKARTPEVGTTESVRDLSWKDIARTREVGTTESVRDLSGDGLSSKDKAIILVQPHHPLLFS